MNDQFLGTTSVTYTGSNSALTTVEAHARELLGEPERLAWFHDTDTGLVYVVPESEVSLR